MKRGKLSHVAFAAVLAVPGVAFGQTIQERVDALEEKVEEQQKSLASFLGIDMHMMLDVQYLYSFNRPDGDTVEYRVFDPEHNDIDLNQFNLYIARQKEDESVGFVANLDFGQTAEGVGSVTCWNSSCDSSESDNSFELREAYLTYKVPFGGITLKGGKFVTLLGYEVIKSWDSFNHNVSNSIMFGWAIPFTHTGLLANIPLGEYASFDIGVVNGWDTVADNNDSKSLLWGLGITPLENFSMYFAGTFGAEEADNGHSKRTMFTANATYTPIDRLTLVIDGNYGFENDAPYVAGGEEDADWRGVAGYVLYQLTDSVALNFRAEVFDDPDGFRSGFQAPGLEPGVTVWEVTPTVAWQVTDNLLARAEYRHDEADKPFFGKKDQMQSGSDTVSAELIYAF